MYHLVQLDSTIRNNTLLNEKLKERLLLMFNNNNLDTLADSLSDWNRDFTCCAVKLNAALINFFRCAYNLNLEIYYCTRLLYIGQERKRNNIHYYFLVYLVVLLRLLILLFFYELLHRKWETEYLQHFSSAYPDKAWS